MNGKAIICQKCGKETVLTQKCGRQKFCPECRIVVAKEQRREAHRRCRERKKKEQLHAVDNPRMLAVCLNCKRERCTGSCNDVMSLVARRKVAANGV